MLCPKCGKSNEESSKFCSGCASALPQTEIEVHSNPNDFYKAILGPKNQDYYLNQFARFDQNGKAGASWHWPAFFVTFYWLLYRKMWLNAVMYLCLPYVLMFILGMIAALAGNSANIVIGIGYILFFVIMFVLPPIYANAFYYNHCKKKIIAVNSTSEDLQRKLGELSGIGGTSNVALIFVLIFAFISFIGILAAIAIPAYQDYLTKAHLAQAVIIEKNAARSVVNYYNQHQEFPSSLEQAGFAEPIPPSIKTLSIDIQNGTLIATMAASSVINGKTLLLIPSLDSDEQITWTCMSQEILDKLLPKECQQQK